MSNKKPTPPPLDDEQAVAAGAHGDAPHAESGKATADDAKAADAAATRAADPRHVARDTPAPDDEVPPPRGTLAPDATPGAVISRRSGQYVARPDPTRPISATEDVVLGNWVGRYHDDDGNPCPAYVKHGTPIADLPHALARSIVATRGQVVGPLPPKAPPNPFTP